MHTAADGASTRELLLDAAAEAIASGADWDRLRMADVARTAGVSRQTLYYEFGSKDALAQAVAMREAERYMAGADQAVAQAHDAGTSPGRAVAAAAEYTLTAAADNPLLKAVLTDDSGALLPLLTTRSGALLAAVDAHCASYLTEHWPHLEPAVVALAADTVNRLTLSHLVLPGARPEQVAADLARLIDALLAPALPARDPSDRPSPVPAPSTGSDR